MDASRKKIQKEIGKRMRMVRKAVGLTQEKIVDHFPCGRANFSRIEKGQIAPGPLILNTLRTTFNVSLDWLLTGTGEMFHRNETESPKVIELAKYSAEMSDLIFYLDRLPMVKHAVLGFFIEYKVRNRKFIEDLMAEDSATGTDEASSI